MNTLNATNLPNDPSSPTSPTVTNKRTENVGLSESSDRKAEAAFGTASLLDQKYPKITVSDAFEFSQSVDQSPLPLPSHISYRARLLLEDVEQFRQSVGLPAKPPLRAPNETSEMQNLSDELIHWNLIWEAYDKSGWFDKLRQSPNWSNDSSSPTPPTMGVERTKNVGLPVTFERNTKAAFGTAPLLGHRLRCKTKNLVIRIVRKIWDVATLGRIIMWPKCLWYYDFTWLHQDVTQHIQSSRGQSKTPAL